MQFATAAWWRGAGLALLLALIVPILAACGGAAPATTAPTAAPAAAPTAAPEPTAAAPAASNGGITQNNGLSVASVKSCDAPYQGLIKEIAAVDKSTVRFTMCAPDPAFPSKVAFASFGIEPSEYFEKTGGSGDLLDKPVGTGPYMLDTWSRGESVNFKRFDGYWGNKAKAEKL